MTLTELKFIVFLFQICGIDWTGSGVSIFYGSRPKLGPSTWILCMSVICNDGIGNRWSWYLYILWLNQHYKSKHSLYLHELNLPNCPDFDVSFYTYTFYPFRVVTYHTDLMLCPIVGSYCVMKETLREKRRTRIDNPIQSFTQTRMTGLR